MTSKTGVTQDDPSTLSSITDDPKKSSNMTPDKGHRKNLVASPPLRKCPIHWRETSETRGSKNFYTGWNISFTKRSHDKESTES